MVLKCRQMAGEIKDLRLQVDYHLLVNGTPVCTYTADFVYDERQPGRYWFEVVEDAKGHKTAIYRLKKKLMKALLGIEIKET